jgi:ABC superfamily ATP binding cassette transporter permease
MSSAEQTPHTGMSRSAEIRLVAGRELRTQLFKRASLVTAVVMLVLAVGGILVYARFSGGDDDPYRLGVIAPDAAASSAIASDLAQVKDSEGRTVSIVDLTGSAAGPALGIGDGAGEARADMVLDLTDQRPRLLVTKESDSDRAVTTSVTAVLQQSALAQKVTDLGSDPAAVAGGLLAAVPQVEALDPPRYDAADFGPRYGMLLTIDVLLIAVIMAGGQIVAMGVVEEKSSRIVEILLACVRPTSLLAGKVLGTGTAVIVQYGLIGIVAGVTAKAAGVLPDTLPGLDSVLIAMVMWLVVGYAIAAVAYGAAGSLVSCQEDAPNVTTPLTMIFMVPYMLTFAMISDPSKMIYHVLAYIPPFSSWLMPARLVIGESSWAEQLVALAIAIATLPLLVRLAATIYTRAVTRTGARVRLKEALGRQNA